ncbi:MAG: hypothetical protein ACQEVA_00350 [Myxococcota bacterium]
MASNQSDKTTSTVRDDDERDSDVSMLEEDSTTEDDEFGAFGRGLGRSVDSVAESEDESDANEFRASQLKDRTDTYSIFPTLEGDDEPVDIPAEDLVPVDQEWPEASEVDTEEFIDRPSTPAHGVAANATTDAVVAEISDDTLRWLDAWAARDGTYVVKINSSNLQAPLKLVVVDGQLCFGMQIGKVPFLDVALKRHVPNLVARLVELYRNREQHPGLPLDSLVGRDELELTDQERNALMALMVRTLVRVAPFENHAVSVEKVDQPQRFEPLAFSPLELVLSGREKTEVAIGPLLERIPAALQARALQHWCFTNEKSPDALEALVASSAPGNCRLIDAYKAFDLGRRLVAAARQTDGDTHEFTSGIGLDGQVCWFAATDGEVMLVYSFEPSNLGLILRTAREFSTSREHIRASS